MATESTATPTATTAATATPAVNTAEHRPILEALHLDKKRIDDTLRNPKLTSDLVEIAQAAKVDAATGVPKEIGNLLYSIATEYPATGTKEARTIVLLHIVAGKITSKAQLLAAFELCGKGGVVSAEQLDVQCGVGVNLTQPQMDEAVKQLAEANPTAAPSALFKLIKAHTTLKWGDMAFLKKCADAHAKVAEQHAPAKAKPTAASTTTTAAAPKAKAPATMRFEDLVEDPALPAAVRADILECGKMQGKRVRVFGWVHHIRTQKSVTFVDLRDGQGFLQCVLTGPRVASEALLAQLLRESSVELTGVLNHLPEGKRAAGVATAQPLELIVDWWRIVGKSDVDLEKIVQPDSTVPQRFDQRHIIVRGERTSAVLKLRSVVMQCFREYLFAHKFTEVTPPTIVQTQCEGGSDLFEMNYFGEKAYMTQSSQLYLETVIPAVGPTFCVLPSFRAEQSRTPRHLAEYTHMEAEMPFIVFEDLLAHLEDTICTVCAAVLERAPQLVKYLNPNFEVPVRPFKRMTYREAINFCNEHHIINTETQLPFEYGQDITEKPEREMCALIGKPIFLMRFPVEMKAFYMKRPADDRSVTESVDVLMPGVGEIVGGSMRIDDYDELMAAYARNKLDPSPYYWFTDQRKYGTCPHGGYGLGVERFLMWMTADPHIRNMCLYPRHIQRCTP
ncbi:asparagine-tRNA ligase [Pelomyxa schiedti]|nr:asparagine-tRNA ligase [Pelomyxa schiedti]